MPEPRSALVALVPQADPVVAHLRLAHDPAARAGLAAHVTVLFPFVPPARLDLTTIERLTEQFARGPGIAGSIELRFDRLARFPGETDGPGVSYLALAGDAMAAKTRALARAWPDYPPYEGRFADTIPHLTIAYGDDSTLAAVEAEVSPALPLVADLRVVTLIVEVGGRWQEHTRFALDP